MDRLADILRALGMILFFGPLALFCLFVIGLVLYATVASASTTIAGGAQPYQRWVDEAQVATPDVTIAVIEGEPERCSGADGCTDGTAIWIQPIPGWLAGTRLAFLHELGHVFDFTTLPEWARAQFRVLTGYATKPWADEGERLGLAELFAESWRLCAWPAGRRSAVGIETLRRSGQLPRVCALIDRAAA
jgi:hypothetical protein